MPKGKRLAQLEKTRKFRQQIQQNNSSTPHDPLVNTPSFLDQIKSTISTLSTYFTNKESAVRTYYYQNKITQDVYKFEVGDDYGYAATIPSTISANCDYLVVDENACTTSPHMVPLCDHLDLTQASVGQCNNNPSSYFCLLNNVKNIPSSDLSLKPGTFCAPLSTLLTSKQIAIIVSSSVVGALAVGLGAFAIYRCRKNRKANEAKNNSQPLLENSTNNSSANSSGFFCNKNPKDQNTPKNSANAQNELIDEEQGNYVPPKVSMA